MSPALILAWLLRHEVLVGWLAVVVGAGGLMGGVYAFGHHAGAAAERPKVVEAQAQARTATAQTTVTTAAAQAADAATVRSTRIAAQAEEAVHAVQTVPGASSALDADMLSRWRSGLVGLRAEAAGADRAGGGQPASAMPPT